MTVSAFLTALAERFEAAPNCDSKLAHHCRDYATLALAHEAEYDAALRERERVRARKRRNATLARLTPPSRAE